MIFNDISLEISFFISIFALRKQKIPLYMSQFLEKTCKCIKELNVLPDGRCPNESELNFHRGREYQVDIYALFYKVYQNGGYNDYVFLNDDEFNESFELIK